MTLTGLSQYSCLPCRGEVGGIDSPAAVRVAKREIDAARPDGDMEYTAYRSHLVGLGKEYSENSDDGHGQDTRATPGRFG